MKNNEDIRDLNAKLISLPGYKILQEMNILNDSMQILNANFVEVEKHIKNFRSEPFNKNVTLNPNLETKRLVHNYLSSAISLVDHTRNYIKNIHKEKEFVEYQPMIRKTFIENPTCVFIKDFRQYLQHFKIPEITFISNALSIKSKWSIKISNDELNKFSGWTKESKKFIISKYPRIDLWEVVETYQEIVNSFYNWLLEEQKKIFSDEFKEVEDLKLHLKNSKIDNLINDILLKKFLSFKSFEKEFNSIFESNDVKNISDLNEIEKISKMIKIINPKEHLKLSIQESLESILL